MAGFDYFIGILLALIATVMFNLAPILQKDRLDTMKEVSFDKFWDSVKMMLGDKKWVIGMLVGMFGGVPYFFAVNYVGSAVVQPLIAFGYIVLVFAASKILHEKLNIKAKSAITLLIIMPIFIVLGNVSNTTENMTDPAVQLNLILFTVIISIFVAIMWVLTKKFPILWAPVTGTLFSSGAIYMQAILAYFRDAGYDLNTQLGLLFKLLFTSSDFLIVWFLIIMCAFFNIIAGYVNQIGLQKVAASKFQPINQTLNNMLTIFAGLTLYGQIVGSWFFYVIAIVMALIGTVILGQFEIPSKNKDSGVNITNEKTPDPVSVSASEEKLK